MRSFQRSRSSNFVILSAFYKTLPLRILRTSSSSMEQLLVCVVADSNMLARRGDPVWKNGWPSWAVIQTPFPQVETHGSQPVPLLDRVRSSSGTNLSQSSLSGKNNGIIAAALPIKDFFLKFSNPSADGSHERTNFRLGVSPPTLPPSEGITWN